MPVKSITPKKKTAKTKSTPTKRSSKSDNSAEIAKALKALHTEVSELKSHLAALTHVLHTEFRTQMKSGPRHVAKRLAQEGLVDND